MAAATMTVARAYQTSFHSRPNATLAVTGGLLNALGMPQILRGNQPITHSDPGDTVAQVSENTVCGLRRQGRDTPNSQFYSFLEKTTTLVQGMMYLALCDSSAMVLLSVRLACDTIYDGNSSE
jgi:hypothetical protein